jgi:hypothetical protein
MTIAEQLTEIRKSFERICHPVSPYYEQSGYTDKEEQHKWNMYFLGYVEGMKRREKEEF